VSNFNYRQYQPFQPIAITDRQWPDQVITEAPQWCSVDLRDGNQALIEPMNSEQKVKLFNLLVKVGFKQIEVGFPAASVTDFDFVRQLIEGDLIPDDVTVQVLTQARDDLIERTFEALRGVNKAIVHLYNSTSIVQREQVFKLDKNGITELAVRGAEKVKYMALQQPETQWSFEYSPESFTGTEMEYAVEICNAVINVWQPVSSASAVLTPVIINLPATVEMSTPNIYADQIEWFCRHINNRDSIVVSVHTHNDRGCAVAAAELAVMAGADRVEGTLLGNGERTGNMDIVTMAMNLYSQGVDPELMLENMDEIIHTVEACTQLPIHPRHPYAGELVFTAFSGSHQDAINKCLALHQPGGSWNVAYLPINPADIGRSYDEVIRINSQSGKGGIAYILERDYGVKLPRWLLIEFSVVVQRAVEVSAREISAAEIWALFQQHYLHVNGPAVGDYSLEGYQINRRDKVDSIEAGLLIDGQKIAVSGQGSGVIDAFVTAVNSQFGTQLLVVDYSEHALHHETALVSGSKAEAIAYVMLNIDGIRVSGVACDEDIVSASLQAIMAAVNDSKVLLARSVA
jgi:2-isopropylmalate synthase